MKTAGLILLALAGTAHAEHIVPIHAAEPSVQKSATCSLDIGSHVRWLGDGSAAILTDNPLAGVRLTVGRSLTRVDAPRRDVDVGVFVRWVYASSSGTMFAETLDTEISQHGLAGGVRFDAPVWWRFRAIGQAEVGMARTALAITEAGTEMTPVEDHHWAPYATATLGFDLGIVDNPRFRLGLGIDLGYTVTKPVDLHALPGDRPDEDLSIDTDFASIGKLDTRGVTYSMALRGAF